MKTLLVLITLVIGLFTANCTAQPGGKDRKPPSIEDRLKMIDEKICQPLKLDKTQTAKVADAFNAFFTEMDKLVDFKANPPVMPEKSKADALAKVRDAKIKLIVSESLFTQFLELEKTTRPPLDKQPPMEKEQQIEIAFPNIDKEQTFVDA